MEIIQMVANEKYLIILTRTGALYMKRLGHIDQMWEEIEKPVLSGVGTNLRPLADKIQKII